MAVKTIEIPEFYRDQKILITGGTGFMGKVLIEKLLRSCPDLSEIFVLIRSKRGENASERLKQATNKPLFNKLKKSNPNVLKKLTAIESNMSEKNLGLSEETVRMLKENVTIIFHAAASVRFDDSLRFAVNLNLRGTVELIKMAKQFPKLLVFLHVSTTYAITDRPEIEEKIYPCNTSWRTTLKIVEHQNDRVLNVLTAKYKGMYPNTYTFTKAMSEQAVYDELNGIVPCVIFRPSIVITSLHEPEVGWIDNFNGPVGMLVASGKGVMRSLFCNPNLIADYIPVDVAIKAIIIAAWKEALPFVNSKIVNELEVYNCCTSLVKEVTIRDVIEMGKKINDEYPLNNILWMPGGSVTDSKIEHYIRTFFTQLLPAIFVDVLLKLTGHKTMLMRIQRKIFNANEALEYFLFNQWKFFHTKCLNLNTILCENDLDDWCFDFRDTDPYNYFEKCVLGAREFLLNESRETLDQARLNLKRPSRQPLVPQQFRKK